MIGNIFKSSDLRDRGYENHIKLDMGKFGYHPNWTCNATAIISHKVAIDLFSKSKKCYTCLIMNNNHSNSGPALRKWSLVSVMIECDLVRLAKSDFSSVKM